MWQANDAKINQFVSTNGITFPFLPNAHNVAQDYNASNDYLFIIDGNGVIQYVKPYGTSFNESTLKAIIDPLIQDITGTTDLKTNLKAFSPQFKNSRTFSIFNSAGKKIYSKTGNFKTVSASFLKNSFPVGTYFIREQKGRNPAVKIFKFQ